MSNPFGDDDDLFGGKEAAPPKKPEPAPTPKAAETPKAADGDPVMFSADARASDSAFASGGAQRGHDLFGGDSDLFAAPASSAPTPGSPKKEQPPAKKAAADDDIFGTGSSATEYDNHPLATETAPAHEEKKEPAEAGERDRTASSGSAGEPELTIHTAASEAGGPEAGSPASSEGPSSAKGAGPKEEKNGKHDYIFPNGDLYSGEWVADKTHGQGTMTYQKQGVFTGEFQQGKRVKGEFVYKKEAAAPCGGCTYTGEFKADKWHGPGKLVLAEGGYYEGEFNAGVYEGKGTMVYGEDKETEKFEGQYKKGKPSGQGKMVYRGGKYACFEGKWEDGSFAEGQLKFRDGGLYIGPFKKSKRHGKGSMEFGEENEHKLSKFTGDWAEDVPQKGAMEWRDGNKFDGDFDVKGEPKKGVMTYSNGDVYTGSYADGNRTDKKGIFKFSDGRVLTGEFKKDDCTSGEMQYPDGSKYKGEFAHDVLGARQGQGTCNYANKDVVVGMWNQDKIDSGDKKFADGGSYKGTFDPEEKFNGEGNLRIWPDGKKFEGEFKAGQMVRGKLTSTDQSVYEGTFNEAQVRHGQGKQTTADFVYEGNFAEDVPTEGTLVFKQKEFKEYTGPVNAAFKPHGSGKISWNNGDTYEGSFVEGVLQGQGVLVKGSTNEQFLGEFLEGVLKKGEAKYGEESEVVSYSGEFNSSWQREGQGTVQWKEGHVFVGESKANTLVEGEYKHVGGTVFKGRFNIDGKLFAEGTFHFPEGPEYHYSKTKEGAFPHRLAGILSETEYESKGLDTMAETELSALGIWPELPELSKADRLPSPTSSALEAIQSKGGQLALNDLQEKRTKFINNLETLHRTSTTELEQEAKLDESFRERFTSRWTIAASESFTGEYKSHLQTTQSATAKAQQDDGTLQTERTEATPALGFLVPTPATLEAQIRQAEGEDQNRVALIASLAALVQCISQRKKLLESLKEGVEALDGGKVLMEVKDGNTAEDALSKELEKVAPHREQIKANMGEHQRLFGTIQTQHTTYKTNLPRVQEAALSAVLVDLERGIAAYTSLWNQSTLLNTKLQEQLTNEQEPLSAQISKFVADRGKERKVLANKLMIEDLHAAVIDGDIERIKAVCDDKTTTIDVNEKGANDANALQLAVLRGDPNIITLLASKGGDVRQRDSKHRTFLWLAIEEQKLNCISSLIDCGADPDRAEDEKSGETVLHILSKANKVDIMELLLKSKASPTTASSEGRTALLFGCASGHFEAVKILVEYGASPNSQDNQLDGPLHLASSTVIHSFLVEHGTRLDLVNKKKAKAGDAKALKNAAEKWKKTDTVIMNEPELKEGDPKWTPNEGPKCQWCSTAFGLLTRRHHCRRCGALVCDNCSKKKGAAGKNKIRICDGCFNNLTFLRSKTI